MCAHCGTRTAELANSEYGPLCLPCAYRQNEHDERADTWATLSPSTLGFIDDTE